jgi:hypothetical protein
LPARCCRYCHHLFQPSPYQPQQTVCGQTECQRARRRDYHRSKLRADPVYAQLCLDSQKKWQAEHTGYLRDWRQSHPDSVEQNRRQQQTRDEKRRARRLAKTLLLEKNNSALDLKHSVAGIWLVGPEVRHLEKNNLAFSQVFIFQPLAGLSPPPPTS